MMAVARSFGIDVISHFLLGGHVWPYAEHPDEYRVAHRSCGFADLPQVKSFLIVYTALTVPTAQYMIRSRDCRSEGNSKFEQSDSFATTLFWTPHCSPTHWTFRMLIKPGANT